MRSAAQNNRLWVLLTKHNLHTDGEARAKLAEHFSHGRTTHTSELYEGECFALINHLEVTLEEKKNTMRRLRWRLWFCFSESKYAEFRYINGSGKIQPNFSTISRWCMAHWNKEIADMSERELEKYISIVKHWK